MSHRILSIFWIALGIAAMAGSVGIGVWQANGPGSGFMPFLAGIVIMLCGMSLVLASPSPDSPWPRGWIALRLLVVLAGLVAIGLAMPHVGFVAAAAPVMIVLMLAIERQSLLTVVVVSLTSCVGTYLLFTRLLGTRLPASGFLGL